MLSIRQKQNVENVRNMGWIFSRENDQTNSDTRVTRKQKHDHAIKVKIEDDAETRRIIRENNLPFD